MQDCRLFSVFVVLYIRCSGVFVRPRLFGLDLLTDVNGNVVRGGIYL
jgi:hypothetical protein